MMNKLEKYLIATFILLFFNDVLAESYTAEGCNKLLEKGDAVAAIAYANKLLSTNSSDKDALLCQGRAYSVRGDFTNAVRIFELAERNSREGLDKIVAVFLSANAHKAAKEAELALVAYQKALQQSKAINNLGMQRLAYTSMGDIAITNHQYTLALEHYLISLRLAANDNERGESSEKVAMTYHEVNEHSLAVEYQIKAYLLHGSVGTLDQYANSSILLGRYYALDKNFVAAEKTLNKIIAFAKEQGGVYYEAKANVSLAMVKLGLGDKKAAQHLIEHALSLASLSHDKPLVEEIATETRGLL